MMGLNHLWGDFVLGLKTGPMALETTSTGGLTRKGEREEIVLGNEPEGTRSLDFFVNKHSSHEMKHQRVWLCTVLFRRDISAIREIAKAYNMSMGQLYHYISSKDDILSLHRHMQRSGRPPGSFGVKDRRSVRNCSASRHTLEFMAENRNLFIWIEAPSS
jgi:hypothetical protein